MDFARISLTSIVGSDATVTAVRVSDEAVDGAVRFSIRDLVCAACNQDKNTGAKTLRRILAKEQSSATELQDEIVDVQFKGEREKAGPAGTAMGCLLLLRMLPGEYAKKHRSKIANRLLLHCATDKALVAEIRADERCNRLLNEMGQPQPQEEEQEEPVQQAPPQAAAAAAAALVPIVDSWEEDKARRLDVLKVQRLEFNFETGKKRKLMQLELAQATQDAKIADAKCNATLKHIKAKADVDVEIIEKKAATEADAEERRSQQKQRLIEAEARTERLAMIAKQQLIDEETARLSRQSAVALPDKLEQLALVMRAANMPAERVIAESSRYIELVTSAVVASSAPAEAGAGQQAPVAPAPPVGPGGQQPAGDIFTVRSFVNQHKLLTRVPLAQREGLLSKIGVELKKQCEAQGLIVGERIQESGGSNSNAGFWVHTYAPPVAPLARQIVDKLVQKVVGAPDIRTAFFGRQNNTNATDA